MADHESDVGLPLGEPPPPNFGRNAAALMTDMAMFQVGMTFIGSATVLPAFVATLTDSEVVVGLASGLTAGAWLLPQLFVASAVSRIPRKKPIVMWAAWLSRPILLLIALGIWLFAGSRPTLALGITLLGMVCFFLLDAVVSVPWFDLLGKLLPHRRRGRLLGTAQVVGGLGGIAGGMAVRSVLRGGGSLAYPANYALLFALGALSLIGSAIGLSFLREPPSKPSQGAVPSVKQVLASLPQIFVRDHAFRRLIIVRVLGSFVSVASAFYVLHATRNLGFAVEDTGLFVSAQVAGSLCGGLLMGALQDRYGPLTHMRTVIGISVLAPLIALCSQPLSVFLGEGLLYLYLVLFFCLGLYMSNMGWPYFNWVLEYCPEEQRPLYIGMINTLAALVMLAPTLGGLIVRNISYPAAFLVAAAFALTSLLLSRGVPSTRPLSPSGTAEATE